MRIALHRNDEPIEPKGTVSVYIGNEIYYLSESIDGKLNINKAGGGDDECIMVFPRMANEVEIK